MAEDSVNENGPKIEKDAIARIAEESTLSNAQMQAALLDACGASPASIAKKLGKANNYVYQLRLANPEYKRVVQEFNQVVSRRIVDEVTNIDDLFNMQIGPSAATLIEVRDNVWAKDADRIKASLAFLDRASKAPKATGVVENRNLVIQIPISTMKEMMGVLGETGERGDLELLELLPRAEGRIIEKEEEIGEQEINSENNYFEAQRL